MLVARLRFAARLALRSACRAHSRLHSRRQAPPTAKAAPKPIPTGRCASSCRSRRAGRPTSCRRVVAQRLSEVWGQPVVVENQPGANTAIAAARVAKMPADGYTLLAAMDVTMVLNPITSKNLSYDPLKDFAPITLGVQEHVAADACGPTTARRPCRS